MAMWAVAPCAAEHGCMPWLVVRGGHSGRQLVPKELCQALAASIDRLPDPALSLPGEQEAAENFQSCLRSLLKCLEGPGSEAFSTMQEDVRGELQDVLSFLFSSNLLVRLLGFLCVLDFEAQKDVVRVFGAVMRLSAALGMDQQVIEYVQRNPDISRYLVDGCGRPEVALHCGLMLRSCVRYPELVRILLAAGVAEELIDLARHQSFDISSDAFSSLRELLLVHKAVSAAHLDSQFTRFFNLYHTLLAIENYVAQRQALRLLGELLLHRSFMNAMLAYVGNEQFLQIHMNLLRDSSKAIQIEAFHVFKIFVVNPRKPPRVQNILHKNRDRLVRLLETFFAKKVDDEPFTKDLNIVIETLRNLSPAAKIDSPKGDVYSPKGTGSSQKNNPVSPTERRQATRDRASPTQ